MSSKLLYPLEKEGKHLEKQMQTGVNILGVHELYWE